MTLKAIGPSEAPSSGGPETSLLNGGDGSPHKASSPAVQAAIADLRREFIAECLRVTAVKASHGADNILLGDDINAERDIRLAIENLRAAASSFRGLEQLEAGGDL
jgi:hypothetical protein